MLRRQTHALSEYDPLCVQPSQGLVLNVRACVLLKVVISLSPCQCGSACGTKRILLVCLFSRSFVHFLYGFAWGFDIERWRESLVNLSGVSVFRETKHKMSSGILGKLGAFLC